jgi:hypothetical protein
MDQSLLRDRYRRGLISTKDYERLGEEWRRYGKPTGRGSADFDRMYNTARIRTAY